jgi:hypothetical protein
MASTTQANKRAPVLAHDLRASRPMPNKRPKNGAILMLPVGSTNQVLKYIGKNIVMPNRSKVQITISVSTEVMVLDIADQCKDNTLQK